MQSSFFVPMLSNALATSFRIQFLPPETFCHPKRAPFPVLSCPPTSYKGCQKNYNIEINNIFLQILYVNIATLTIVNRVNYNIYYVYSIDYALTVSGMFSYKTK